LATKAKKEAEKREGVNMLDFSNLNETHEMDLEKEMSESKHE